MPSLLRARATFLGMMHAGRAFTSSVQERFALCAMSLHHARSGTGRIETVSGLL